jgi:hypothetical protein
MGAEERGCCDDVEAVPAGGEGSSAPFHDVVDIWCEDSSSTSNDPGEDGAGLEAWAMPMPACRKSAIRVRAHWMMYMGSVESNGHISSLKIK